MPFSHAPPPYAPPLHGCMHVFLLRKTKKQCIIKMVGSIFNLEWFIFEDKFWILECPTFQDGGSKSLALLLVFGQLLLLRALAADDTWQVKWHLSFLKTRNEKLVEIGYRVNSIYLCFWLLQLICPPSITLRILQSNL